VLQPPFRRRASWMREAIQTVVALARRTCSSDRPLVLQALNPTTMHLAIICRPFTGMYVCTLVFRKQKNHPNEGFSFFGSQLPFQCKRTAGPCGRPMRRNSSIIITLFFEHLKLLILCQEVRRSSTCWKNVH
jgi:hypothetical protein